MQAQKSSSDSFQIGYIDEFGLASLDTKKEGVPSFYVLTAVIVDSDKNDSLEKEVDEIRKRYFQTGVMKSSKVGKKTKRRLKIIKDLAKLDFYFFSFVCDKRELDKNSGFQYKKSFILQ